jgi:outer membrane immunogenic protein
VVAAGALAFAQGRCASRKNIAPIGMLSKAMLISRCDNDWLRLTSDDRVTSRVFDRSVAMRRFFLAAAMFAAVTGAQAADMPDFLRGTLPASSAPTRNWEGWYAGGQVGYSSANMDFSQSIVGLTNFIFRDSVLLDPTSQLSALNKASTQGTGFGAFVGRNWQWDDIVLGVEANYNYLSDLSASSSNSIGPLIFTNPSGDTPPPGVTDNYGVKLTGAASAQVKDMITFRGRAGWATGDFLPYIFGGVAVGRMDVSRSVTSEVTLRQDITTTNILGVTSTAIGVTRPVPSQSVSNSQERTNNFVAGWTAGLGMEYMVWGNVFLRGEWEYVKFLSVENTNVTLNSVRAGLGYKF